jgi:hypothetical protein
VTEVLIVLVLRTFILVTVEILVTHMKIALLAIFLPQVTDDMRVSVRILAQVPHNFALTQHRINIPLLIAVDLLRAHRLSILVAHRDLQCQ